MVTLSVPFRIKTVLSLLIGNDLKIIMDLVAKEIHKRKVFVPKKEMRIHFKLGRIGFQDNLYVRPMIPGLRTVSFEQ